MIRIIHASDFHFTGPYFSEGLWKQFSKKAAEISPDVIIVTGDITDDGYPHEYLVAKDRLDSLGPEVLVVPGNHDARNVGYEVFEQHFGPRWRVWQSKGLTILCGDSSEPDIDDGHIGRENYLRMEHVLNNGEFRIFALHHHLLPVPGTGRDRNIPVDAGDALKILTSAKTDLVLSGHKHVAWSWKLESTVFLSAGTASTTRVKSSIPPSFYYIDVKVSEKDFEINKIELHIRPDDEQDHIGSSPGSITCEDGQKQAA